MDTLPKIEPMKLFLIPEPFDHPDWLFELKHDGFRALAYVENGVCSLISRRNNAYKSVPELQTVIGESLRVKDAILDGEIVCLDSKGRSVFKELLHRRGEPIFYVFDLLWLNGCDLRQQPLLSRKRTLKRLIRSAKCPRLLYAQHIQDKGIDMFCAVCETNAEGIVAKRKNGVYGAGERWFKIKNPMYTQAEGRRELFESMRLPGPKKAKPQTALDEKTGA